MEEELPFSMIGNMLERNKKSYLNASSEAEASELRNALMLVIGNCAILASSERDEFFETFVEWLRAFRKELKE